MLSFHELYEQHSRDVYRFALFLSGDPALAEDLTADTFVLLPLYFAGQVSEDTKTLIAEFFEADPEFGRMAERFAKLLTDERRSIDRDRSVLALDRTRRFVRYRNQLMGFAVAYSMLPFLFFFDDGRITFVMWRDKPLMAVLFALGGLGCWIGAYVMSRRSRHTGL